MESILRLMEWMKSSYILLSAKTKEELNGILNAIEDEAMSQRTLGWKEGFDAGFASADDWLADHEDAMVEHGWVKLPLDADGVPIHVGDMMERERDGHKTEIMMLGLNVFGWYVNHGKYTTSELHHYQTPTIEDLLRKFALECEDAGNSRQEVERIASEYAAKLRLKEG